MYQFPSVTAINPVTGKPNGTNCKVCVSNPDASDPHRSGTPMLPVGKYVVEVVVPPGYELVKEEDKNILIGDNFIAPVTQEIGGLGNVFILPDQAEIANSYNGQNSTQSLGRNSSLPSHEGDTGSIETYWPCVGAARIVPDFISLFPQSQEVAPFAGATRNLCDRKEITLTDQTSALAKFYLFTSTHIAAHFTGVITDDFTSEPCGVHAGVPELSLSSSTAFRSACISSASDIAVTLSCRLLLISTNCLGFPSKRSKTARIAASRCLPASASSISASTSRSSTVRPSSVTD